MPFASFISPSTITVASVVFIAEIESALICGWPFKLGGISGPN